MKTLLIKTLSAAGLAAVVTSIAGLSVPQPVSSFSTIGGSLSQGQRDFRVFNNFTDAQANNNSNPHPNFPGAVGAIMSIWKAHAEWASEPYAGNGAGDPSSGNTNLGDGNANFDNTYQGETFAVGNTNQNIHSEIAQSNFGALAFAETPISDGWRVRYYQSPWTWQDGPGQPSSGSDIQGVATHEIGHTFGLGHETGCATMNGCAGTCIAQRSICNDDVNGIQFIYGVRAADKVQITSLGGSKNIGEVLVINGDNFSSTGNEVWFTKLGSSGVPTKVTGVNSSGGGTVINVTIPAGVGDGEVLVKRVGSGGDDLSNAFPIDIGTGTLNPPFIASITPTIGQAGGFDTVTIFGGALSTTTSVQFEGVEVIDFTVVDDSELTVTTPAGSASLVADVTVDNGDGTFTLDDAYQYTFNNPPDITAVTPSTGPEAGGTTVIVSGPSVVGAATIEFDGVAASDVEVLSATQVQCVTPAGTGTVDVKVTVSDGLLFFDNDTLPNGFTYEPGGVGGTFTQYGTGSGGSLGVPDWDGSGDLTPGSASGFTLTLSNAAPFAPATLLVGLSSSSLPLKGQTLLLFPIQFQIPLGNVGAGGTISLPAVIPAGTPSLSLFEQVWIVDGTGVQGLTSTNGLQIDIP